ncbi:hypothetical protein [Devriesea agamarum]|uniref:hypothetical protein n=1 Tax=Devriesea agamarum TaxID=472569 RepID=UPI00155EF68F|nr:hypothetical protein [Devriesea agamarum]
MDELVDAGWGESDAVFVVFDLAGYADQHGPVPPLEGLRPNTPEVDGGIQAVIGVLTDL